MGRKFVFISVKQRKTNSNRLCLYHIGHMTHFLRNYFFSFFVFLLYNSKKRSNFANSNNST